MDDVIIIVNICKCIVGLVLCSLIMQICGVNFHLACDIVNSCLSWGEEGDISQLQPFHIYNVENNCVNPGLTVYSLTQ